MLKLIFFLVIAALASCDENEPRARLLVSKQVLNKYLVENMDITVKYSLHNVGNTAAYKVELEDRGFPTDSFSVVGGSFSMKLDRIRPQENITHMVVVRPNKYGYFNFTSARVKYFPSEDSKEVRIFFSFFFIFSKTIF